MPVSRKDRMLKKLGEIDHELVQRDRQRLEESEKTRKALRLILVLALIVAAAAYMSAVINGNVVILEEDTPASVTLRSAAADSDGNVKIFLEIPPEDARSQNANFDGVTARVTDLKANREYFVDVVPVYLERKPAQLLIRLENGGIQAGPCELMLQLRGWLKSSNPVAVNEIEPTT